MTPDELMERQIDVVYGLVDDEARVVYSREEIIELLRENYPRDVANILMAK